MKKFLILLFPITAFLFFSCTNFFDNQINEIEKASDSVSDTLSDSSITRIVTVTGNFYMDGAFPEEILKQVQDDVSIRDDSESHAELVSASQRTAFPGQPVLNDYDIKVTAVNVDDKTDVVKGAIVAETKKSKYYINIPISDSAKTYEVIITATASELECFYGKSDKVTISESSSVLVKDIRLHAETSKGTGSVSLKVSVDSEIKSARVFYNNSNVVCNASSNLCTFNISELDCGSYQMTFNFYKGTNGQGALLYSFTQIVNVYKNLSTNTWVKNGAEPYFTTSGNENVCSITKAVVESFKITEFYVDGSRQNTQPGKNGYTTESGTFINPCTSIDAAITKLADGTKDYTIYVKGEVKGAQTISSDLKQSGSGKYNARSLKICGISTPVDGVPQDSLNGNFGNTAHVNGTTLTINSEVPVTIENLSITGGNTTGDGGGIKIESGTVKLADGTKITGNNASENGGGVYVSANARLFMYGTALIGDSGNSAPDSKTRNYANLGGGIFNEGTVYLGYSDYTDSSHNKIKKIPAGYGIRRNESKAGGGGIRNIGSVYAASGDISYNYGTNGGAVAFSGETSSVFEMKNVTLKGNHASVNGGSFYIASGRTSLIDCEISANTAGTRTTDYGGALYIQTDIYIGGSTCFTNGSSKNNDIYISNGKINLLSPLSTTGIVATVTYPDSAYKNTTEVLAVSTSPAAAEGTSIKNECGKFDITPQVLDEGGSRKWSVDSSGKLSYIQNVYLTKDELSSFTPNSSTVYNIEVDSSLTTVEVKTLMTKLSNSNRGVGEGSSLDLSKTSVTNMDSNFWIYSGITYLTLPDNLSSIAEQTFENNQQLKEIIISSSNTNFVTEDGVLYNKAKTKLYRYPPKKTESTFTLPDTVTELSYGAFEYDENLVTINGLSKIKKANYLIFKGSKKLEEVDFSGLTENFLHYRSIYDCNVKKVILSSSIKKIGETFIDCPLLTEIHFRTTEPPIIGANENTSYEPSNVIFSSCNANLKFYVPNGCKDAYMNDTIRTGCFNGPLNYLSSNLETLIVQE